MCFSRAKMITDLYSVPFLAVVLFSSKLIVRFASAAPEQNPGDNIVKDCNGILYRLMIDSGVPPFPATACDVKQKVINCFEDNQGSGNLLDKDRFLLLQSAVVDKSLNMCPDLTYQELEKSIQNSAVAQALLVKFPIITPSSCPEQFCAEKIHKSCEKKIFDQMVVNHLPWPKTTKWRTCYSNALKETPCTASILQNYATLQKDFGECLRDKEYSLGLFGIFMNDHHESSIIINVPN